MGYVVFLCYYEDFLLLTDELLFFSWPADDVLCWWRWGGVLSVSALLTHEMASRDDPSRSLSLQEPEYSARILLLATRRREKMKVVKLSWVKALDHLYKSIVD